MSYIEILEDQGFAVEKYGEGFILAWYKNDMDFRYYGKTTSNSKQPIIDLADVFATEQEAWERASTLSEIN